MHHHVARFTACLGILVVIGCAKDPILTIPIHESPNAVVRLMAIPYDQPERNFSHPAFLTVKQMIGVLNGIYVENANTVFSFMSSKGPNSDRQPAFSDEEVNFLAPLLVKGLSTATPDEIVSFYGTADISKTFRRIKSGGIFVQGKALFVVLSNFRTKVPIWQDADEYKAPYRLNPLESITSPSGRLIFLPTTFAFDRDSGLLPSMLQKQRLVTGVLYESLPAVTQP